MRERDQPRGSVRSDTRGVSPVIGAVLVLGLLMLTVTVLQTTAIPPLNAQHEFQHSQDVRADLLDLESTTDRVAATGAGETATVAVGTRYPQRLLFINPPPVSGTLRTTGTRNVTISNANATGETGHYWNGTARDIPTTTVVYRPAYNEYDAAPTTVYEPWVVYNRDGGRTNALTELDLVDGRQISLTALDGELSESSAGTASVNLAPNSAPVETVAVRNDTDQITLTVPTDLRNDTWTRLLADEMAGTGDGHVTGYSCRREPPRPCGALTVTLEPGTYELRLGEVGVGARSTTDPAVYLTDVEGDLTAVLADGRQRLVVQARDRFDNPVSGVEVNWTSPEYGRLRAVSPTTGDDGQAVFVYEAPETVSESRNVTVSTDFGVGDAQRTVTFDVRVVALGGGRTGDDPDGTTQSTDAVSADADSLDIRRSDSGEQGRRVTFAMETTEPVTITGYSVTTQNDLERPFVERGTTFDGGSLPVTVTDRTQVTFRDIDDSRALKADGFVDPTSDDTDVLVELEFEDGSTRTLGIDVTVPGGR